jgi:antitoxin VapB
VSRAARRAVLLERAAARGAAGIVLRTFADVAWYTGGFDVRIDRSSPSGSTVVLVTAAGEWVVTDVIEGPRLRDEEPTLVDLDIVEHPWTSSPDEQVRELAGGGLVLEADDVGIADLRMVLDEEAVDRYRILGRDLTAAFEDVAAAVTPETTELEVAGRVAAAAWAVGAHAPVLLVAGADRIPRYRHPLPTPASLGDRVMFVACFERGGLFASSTRYVHFAEPDAELARRLAATDEILRRLREEATAPGRTLGDAFADCRRFYAEAGFAEEWQLHHQGGIAGYRSREAIAKPDDPTVLRPGMAFAWNPSITGAKSEETFVLLEGGSTEVLA